MSEFRSTTREIIKLTEQVSGFPVVVQPEPRLSLLGAMRAARGNQPGHVVFYKPYFGTQPDYVQSVAGFLPSAKRLNVSISRARRKAVVISFPAR